MRTCWWSPNRRCTRRHNDSRSRERRRRRRRRRRPGPSGNCKLPRSKSRRSRTTTRMCRSWSSCSAAHKSRRSTPGRWCSRCCRKRPGCRCRPGCRRSRPRCSPSTGRWTSTPPGRRPCRRSWPPASRPRRCSSPRGRTSWLPESARRPRSSRRTFRRRSCRRPRRPRGRCRPRRAAHRGARPLAGRLGARLALPGAGGVAANTVGAITAHALGPARAGLPCFALQAPVASQVLVPAAAVRDPRRWSRRRTCRHPPCRPGRRRTTPSRSSGRRRTTPLVHSVGRRAHLAVRLLARAGGVARLHRRCRCRRWPT